MADEAKLKMQCLEDAAEINKFKAESPDYDPKDAQRLMSRMRSLRRPLNCLNLKTTYQEMKGE
jgi:hypothetical protein